MDDDEEFYDTISISSQLVGKRRSNSKEYISLSRNTVYHSALDLEMELSALTSSSNNRQPQRSKNWRSFSMEDKPVDFVLAYEETNDNMEKNKDFKQRRATFEHNLEQLGLHLEKADGQKIHFTKIHAPDEVLYRYVELMKLRMPIKTDPDVKKRTSIINSLVGKVLDACNVKQDPNLFPPKKYKLTAQFRDKQNYLFDIHDPDFLNSSVRIDVVSYILAREKYGESDDSKGIKKLLAEEVYKAAYPLHDGDLHHTGTMRKKLLDEWASVSKWIKFQPIDEIKDYFGVKFALYFAWLGFYTHMLIPAAIVGLLCLIYGIATLKNDTISQDICHLNITMCPLCDKYCTFWNLKDTCTYSQITYLVDNPITIFFAIFMSLWTALYLELWKRYSAEIAHRWGLTGFDLQAEEPRPEYSTRLANAKKQKLNVVTLLSEPVVPFWKLQLPSIVLSFSIVLIWMILAVCVVFGIVIYRMSLVTSDTLYSDKSSYRIYVVPITAGIINLICIIILNFFYNKLAIWLTDMEIQRTQTEYDDSLTLKIYLFQFVNYYTSIFYIGFLKGKFVGYPAKYNKIFGFRQEECNPGGCLMELTIQLAIIMVGNQAMNSIFEIVIPLLKKMYNKFALSSGIEKTTEHEVIGHNQWTEDYKLSDLEPQGLFHEYLEMILQFGFVTIFVTAFPLAPLFALINNIFEMRLDAKKMVKYFRRPVPQRVKDIGVWLHIMNIICRLSIVSNAFIIAFSSHFIPKMVYMMKVNSDHTENGFLEHSLAYFNTADFQNGTAPEDNLLNVTMCRYAEYRNPPDHEFKYKRPLMYWHVTAARLAFIVVYQNLVGLLITCIQVAIPDIPSKLSDRIKRETYQTNKTIIEYENNKFSQQNKNRNRESILSDDSTLSFIDEEISTEDQNGDLLHRKPHGDQNETTNL